MNAILTLALTLSLAQAPAHGTHAGEAPEAAAPAHEGGAGEHAAAAEGGHGAAEGGHGGGLSEALMHHVTDGHVLEYPGICHGGFAWNCELDLNEVFGTHVDPVTHEKTGPLVFGSLDMTPSKHAVMMWLASIVLIVAFVLAVRKKGLVPRGLYNFLEMLVQFVRNEIARKNIGEHDGDRFVPYLVTAFFFILFVNLFGLLPWSATATGNLSVTVAMALFTFVITQYAAIKAMGLGGWLKHLTGGVAPWLWPIMVPVEILGLFTKPFALTVRLFANMVAGHIVIFSLIGLIFALGHWGVAFGSVPMALGIYLLELFVAFVQAYIFTMLSSLFIGQGLAHHGHDEEHAEHGHAEPGMGSAGHGNHGSHVAGTSPGHG